MTSSCAGVVIPDACRALSRAKIRAPQVTIMGPHSAPAFAGQSFVPAKARGGDDKFKRGGCLTRRVQLALQRCQHDFIAGHDRTGFEQVRLVVDLGEKTTRLFHQHDTGSDVPGI